MKIPSELKHKPVIVSEDYDRIDGRKAHNSDAKGLSLGLAQWNERGNVDISAKVWRHTGGKWSRQSEELPLHRVLDLAILIVKSRKVFLERYHKNEKDYPNYPALDRIGLQGDAMNVQVCIDNEFIEDDLDLFEATLAKDDEIISERLNVLMGLLNDLKS
ncbi:MAG: hypothetical protein HOD43_14895 [Candidatus Marinimicrobia bacterium]|jgi:hypothetical protein|nr:hypothetical protein [Candidatus Neomarinimicrobiota bacterium]MBT3631108.1 hypothetical protein [Candidatus Neomarinimicrobiota bacterium]MBT3825748.1 hypothetical protein [Candidatus Neomarinimicrobiota bacterium]MBT4130508.1 hypothetical protein [Candidatus Neomarinimicrobiota bacterium]MBT4297085.1 hypothetical protein [Candidatus Neomarinimicrobiota bacterium]